jgi:SAM-dependent methyltransferase
MFGNLFSRHLPNLIHRFFPRLWYFLLYRRAVKNVGDKRGERESLFKELIDSSRDKDCLQIGVRNKKYAPHWVSVDLYDEADYIDYRYDIQNLEFEKEKFDVVVCNAILEHVEDPRKAIKELHRVTKRGGVIWVEVPFNQPYHPSPNDYWRVSPRGVRIWMSEFTELSSGLFTIDGSSIYNGVYFYGKK